MLISCRIGLKVEKIKYAVILQYKIKLKINNVHLKLVIDSEIRVNTINTNESKK